MPLMRTALLAWLAVVSLGAAAATTDGPYVIRTPAGVLEAWSVESADGTDSKQVRAVAPGVRLTVPGVGKLPAFQVTLREPAKPAPDTVAVGSAKPLFVVADTHGEFEILVDMLRAHRIVNARLGWSFGAGQLVVLGDVLDRGANQIEILWLLYELEAQARRAGGAVHLLLGNHETMVMRGDLRYMNPKYARSTAALGMSSYAQLFDAGSVLGQWLRSRPALLKLGELLCLHGGISRELLDRQWSLAEINAGVRTGLQELPPFSPAERERVEFLLGPRGPLWFRGYFANREDSGAVPLADVDAALSQFGVARILVGHTIMPTITPLYGGKVIAVQVYPSHDAAGRDRFEALLIRKGRLLRALPDGSTQPID
jgi:hypothetical protein